MFDTMGPWERDRLIEGLARIGVHPDDIEYLVCSHSHPDHIGNNNLFTKAKVHIVGTSVYTNDCYNLGCFEPTGSYNYVTSKGDQIEVIQHKNYELSSHLSIQPTPGHTLECVSLLVNNCDGFGNLAMAGDLFEREEDVLNEGVWLGAGSQQPDQQRAHRSQIYNKADFIVPGHGPLFKTNQVKPIRF